MFKFTACQEDGRTTLPWIVITDRHCAEQPLALQIAELCKVYTPQAIIVREKDVTGQVYEKIWQSISSVANKKKILVLMHNHPNLAIKNDAVGVHMPLMPWLRWRKNAPSEAQRLCSRPTNHKFGGVGVSVHSVEEAMIAEASGANYIIASPVFPTSCKPDAQPLGLRGLAAICHKVSCPVYALGGLQLNDIRQGMLVQAGVAGYCVRSAAMNFSVNSVKPHLK